MASLTVSDITKVYGGETVALDDVSFEIPDGEFVVLLGPSGAGKSTLLRLLNGLERPTEGEIRIGDDRVSGTRSDVAMVFQMHYLVESMSAYRNALTGALNRTDTVDSVFTRYDEDDKEMALRSLETVGLLEEANQRADSMSGGQQQRVGIARALTQDPQLLLADEPVASLDPKAAQDVMHYMKRAAAERNLTSIVSLHQVNIAREFGERFIGLRDGNVVFDGGKDDLTMEDVDRIYYGESPENSAINNIA
ncbi:ABC-type phosphate/phosphonate/phosphite transport system, ATP-binding protein [Haladaptatus paucihalophilus DX253]|uniref:ABC-type phosphate/phosphonate/phosphite transport system, ATP-binding protein n=1 Tax=Haladaptatus paucihalophilus DX253 TaxID=797209 RepID=E7QNB4_HALPU|nr:phosphonate ABC transporter ATP-binding protein [Haladaptatus paucihalophilus]EFW93909.1 ABC-type phosphate/phosphonate/phosphite transport system, ATP-binding protein [Haladaptatus paucihalophilus DX253]SHK67109.1 phosphonate transport system ATP-binding protein [Haladaptatus paucihalophilus DX253]